MTTASATLTEGSVIFGYENLPAADSGYFKDADEKESLQVTSTKHCSHCHQVPTGTYLVIMNKQKKKLRVCNLSTMLCLLNLSSLDYPHNPQQELQSSSGEEVQHLGELQVEGRPSRGEREETD